MKQENQINIVLFIGVFIMFIISTFFSYSIYTKADLFSKSPIIKQDTIAGKNSPKSDEIKKDETKNANGTPPSVQGTGVWDIERNYIRSEAPGLEPNPFYSLAYNVKCQTVEPVEHGYTAINVDRIYSYGVSPAELYAHTDYQEQNYINGKYETNIYANTKAHINPEQDQYTFSIPRELFYSSGCKTKQTNFNPNSNKYNSVVSGNIDSSATYWTIKSNAVSNNLAYKLYFIANDYSVGHTDFIAINESINGTGGTEDIQVAHNDTILEYFNNPDLNKIWVTLNTITVDNLKTMSMRIYNIETGETDGEKKFTSSKEEPTPEEMKLIEELMNKELGIEAHSF